MLWFCPNFGRKLFIMYVIHFHFSQGGPLHLTKFVQFTKEGIYLLLWINYIYKISKTTILINKLRRY